MPDRIQLSRKKGWKTPENTVIVSRPSFWGNPYQAKNGDRASAVRCYKMELEWYLHGRGASAEQKKKVKDGLAFLRGKNLACWCPLDQPCHADVLLDFANRTEKSW